ncbi:hypothetical protein M441DRAFT_174178 [Trichoderma asperellum CBS 433.97]|uniref:YMC020W-like alpha/beta hydrolase domain-containing protein n=1 Tax=Trichoderma asperellum (strain ATCC 204424 / CBS 433.97 / NBRC 101777) TaxID=1042311 RepID=A0A2T3Z0M8_TRIA4|nr:hypothetical protein M441DRAFT_174178 [Trichoderma asperellum CBS 433.97]PTB38366.1 hypothetical protein M441DRAFT_174178 [Trichoderma asperellum CBS 433.97]
MPPRKRQRPNPATLSSSSLPTTALSPETSLSLASSASAQQASDQKRPPQPGSSSDHKPSDASLRVKEVRKTNSWYATWAKPAKATASTSIARENILGDTVRSRNAPDFSRFDTKRSEDDTHIPDSTDSAAPPASFSSKSRSSSTNKKTEENKPADPLHTGGKDLRASGPAPEMPPIPKAKPASEQQQTPEPQPSQEPQPGLEVSTGEGAQTADAPDASQGQAATAGWFGWWARAPPAEPPAQPAPNPQTIKKEEEQASEPIKAVEPAESAPPEQAPASEPPSAESATDGPKTTSWFGFWYGTPQPEAKAASAVEPDASKEQPAGQDTEASSKHETAAKSTAPSGKMTPLKNEPSKGSAATVSRSSSKKSKIEEESAAKAEDVPTKDVPPPEAPPAQSPPPKAGSTWAFWSREPSKSKEKTPLPESGQIAVIGEGSEVQPAPMAERTISDAPAKDPKDTTLAPEPPAGVLSWRRSKRIRPISMDLDIQRPPSADSTKSAPVERSFATSSTNAGAEQELPASKSLARTDSKKKKQAPSTKAAPESELAVKEPPNVLLPSFSSTYQMKENPSILRQITNLVLRTSQQPPNHVFRVKDTPKIRKAIAIGVHGFFPATYLRPMIGQPTGTSLRFANLCAEAIRRWTDNHGSPKCEIEKVALEGEGRINDRVANLWKLLLNWIEQIRQADLVIIACHSQGVPVSIMLLEKLIDLGVLTDTRVGVCAMAGVALGPFPDYKSSILMGSVAELWEFGDPHSANSKRFEACLKRVVDYGARVTFVGSIDDQVVPMESAVYSPANHPYIYRAVFIDGRVHAPDFISHLIGFALKLRNLGISDHGLIRELSVALAGSLYSGEGHSRLYYDAAVYDLAIMHALETTSTAQPTPCEIPKRDTTPLASSNPYVLPWIMRGLLEEDFVKTQLSAETEELLKQFDDWKPTNKALKDVKYRLEVVRSKL